METEFYMQFTARKNTKGEVTAISALKMTQNDPTVPNTTTNASVGPGAVVVRMKIDIPDAAFMPFDAAPQQISVQRIVDALATSPQQAMIELAQDLEAEAHPPAPE